MPGYAEHNNPRERDWHEDARTNSNSDVSGKIGSSDYLSSAIVIVCLSVRRCCSLLLFLPPFALLDLFLSGTTAPLTK